MISIRPGDSDKLSYRLLFLCKVQRQGTCIQNFTGSAVYSDKCIWEKARPNWELPNEYLGSKSSCQCESKPHQQLFSEDLFLGTVVCISQYKTRLHTGHITLCWNIFYFPTQLFWINVVNWVLLEKLLPTYRVPLQGPLVSVKNRNVVASLTAFEISTVTSNAIKLAFSLFWAQFTWGHWSKASSYLCLYIAHSGDEGRNHTSLVMCLILHSMKITTQSAQTWCLPASTPLCSYPYAL